MTPGRSLETTPNKGLPNKGLHPTELHLVERNIQKLFHVYKLTTRYFNNELG